MTLPTLSELFTDKTSGPIEPDSKLLPILSVYPEETIPSGEPFDFGELPCLSDIKNIWPLGALTKNVPFNENIDGIVFETKPDDGLKAVAESVYARISAKIPVSGIKRFHFERVRDEWIPKGGERKPAFAHRDLRSDSNKVCFGLLAAFPLPTVVYPNVSVCEFLERPEDEQKTKWLTDNERPVKRGHLYIFNEKSLIHRAPINTKSAEEWREELKDIEGAGNFIKTENGIDYIRSILMRGTVELYPEWVREVEAAWTLECVP